MAARPKRRAKKRSFEYDPEETKIKTLALYRRDFACTDTNVGYDPTDPSVF
jgi:hypothetical protein